MKKGTSSVFILSLGAQMTPAIVSQRHMAEHMPLDLPASTSVWSKRENLLFALLVLLEYRLFLLTFVIVSLRRVSFRQANFVNNGNHHASNCGSCKDKRCELRILHRLALALHHYTKLIICLRSAV